MFRSATESQWLRERLAIKRSWVGIPRSVEFLIEDILAENIIHRIAPCKHCPKTFIEIFTPYTFSEKASPFLSS